MHDLKKNDIDGRSRKKLYNTDYFNIMCSNHSAAHGISLSWYEIPDLVFPIMDSLRERELLLTRKLHTQRFLSTNLKSSPRMLYCRHHDRNVYATDDHGYMFPINDTIECDFHYWIFNRSNMEGAITGAYEFTPFLFNIFQSITQS